MSKKTSEQQFLVRAKGAGVFVGGIESRNGDEVTMTNARRVWYWRGATDCIQLAQEGLDVNQSKVTMPAETITILNVLEVHPLSEKARECFAKVPEWKG